MISDLNTAAPITSEDIARMQELAAENAQSILAEAVSTSIHVARPMVGAGALEQVRFLFRVRGCSAERVRFSGCAYHPPPPAPPPPTPPAHKEARSFLELDFVAGALF